MEMKPFMHYINVMATIRGILMTTMLGTMSCGGFMLSAGVSPASAQLHPLNQTDRYMPQRRDSVRPNSQNLMQGPSYWTPEQRRLNVPNADANPSLRPQTGPYPPPPIPVAPPPKKPGG